MIPANENHQTIVTGLIENPTDWKTHYAHNNRIIAFGRNTCEAMQNLMARVENGG